jgi:hypothetical protein
MLKEAAMPWVKAVLRLFFRAITPRRNGRRRVLLACHSVLTASYLAEIWELLRDDERLDVHLCLPTNGFFPHRWEHHPGDWAECRALLPLPEISLRWAKVMQWDLVVLADHYNPAWTAPWRHAVLRISHGIGGKRQANGEDFFYGSGCFDRKGRLVYSCLLESSYRRREQATKRNPAFAGRIAVVGSLRADKLAAAKEAHQRGLAGDVNRKPRVLIASSWDQGNLLERFGDDLLREAEALLDRFDFTLRPHPHLLRASRGDGACWRERFARLTRSGIAFSPPAESPTAVMAAADVVLTDDLSSMGLLTVMAGGRVVIAPSFSPQVGVDTFLARLSQCAPILQHPHQLAAVVGEALNAWPPHGLAELVSDMNGEPGRSAVLVRREVYRLLKLHPPVQPSDVARVITLPRETATPFQ